MAGVTDTIFRRLCKEQGADVMVTEFVSAEGIFRRNERTLEYLEFDETERPLGVQLFGARPRASRRSRADGRRLEAARFHRPEFRLPGEQSRREKRRLVAAARLPAVGKSRARRGARLSRRIPVTAKIRIGWDRDTINADDHGAHFGRLRRPRDRRAWPHEGAGLQRRGGLGRDRAGRCRPCKSR